MLPQAIPLTMLALCSFFAIRGLFAIWRTLQGYGWLLVICGLPLLVFWLYFTLIIFGVIQYE
jgi:hypothetical protein